MSHSCCDGVSSISGRFRLFAAIRRDIDATWEARLGDDSERVLLEAIEAARIMRAANAREAAEMTMGRPLTNREWKLYGERWEKGWREFERRRQ